MSRLSRRNFFALSGAAAAGAMFGRFASACLPPPPDTGSVAAGNTAFSTDLYARLRSQPGNLFCSPFSISTALAMTLAGAKGTTKDEMAKVLRITDVENTHPAFGDLLGQVNRNAKVEKPAYQLTTANAIWAQEGFPWRAEFMELTRKHYGAGLVPVDFNMPEPARKRINAWVEKETRERIKDLIPAGVIDPDTRMVLTNAIYFKSAWFHVFNKSLTKDQPFTHANGTKTDVPLMHQQERFPYAETDDLQVLELPYTKGELSMVVVLPRKPDGLAKVEEGLTAEKLTTWAKAVKGTETRVYLPKFKFEWDKELGPALKEMGMKTPFTMQADFTGMHTSSQKLFISNVLHKAFVAVDEEGTEAAAATAVVMRTASAPIPQEPKVFRADRPFLFVIRDNKTNSVLFLGRYTGPKA